jgi:hypothetical protein
MKLHYLYPPPSPSPGWMWNGAIWNLCDDTKIEISFLDNMLTLFRQLFYIRFFYCLIFSVFFIRLDGRWVCFDYWICVFKNIFFFKYYSLFWIFIVLVLLCWGCVFIFFLSDCHIFFFLFLFFSLQNYIFILERESISSERLCQAKRMMWTTWH